MVRFDWCCYRFIACVLLGLTASTAVEAQSEQYFDWCENKARNFSRDLEISGCTGLIESGRLSGKGLASAYANRGTSYYYLKDYARAQADFAQALLLNPDHSNTYFTRANLYYDTKDYPRAIADYSQVIRLDPKDAEAINLRGLAYEANGDRERAIADLRQAHALGFAQAAGHLRRLGVTP